MATFIECEIQTRVPHEMESCSELFEKILEKPGLYIGYRSVVLLDAFISGYQHALLIAGEETHDPLYIGFARWVEKKFALRTSHGWASIIAFMSPGEESAFETTKDLWSEYKALPRQQKLIKSKERK
jgi:hypothetical protein